MGAKYASACSHNRPTSAPAGSRRFLFVDNSAPKRRRWGRGGRHLHRIEEAIPVKTPDGVSELAHRARGLSQRHRTVLLLVDGQRRVSQILSTAQAAGVQASVFDELVSLGMVKMPAVDHIDLPLDAANLGGDSSLLPAARSLL